MSWSPESLLEDQLDQRTSCKPGRYLGKSCSEGELLILLDETLKQSQRVMPLKGEDGCVFLEVKIFSPRIKQYFNSICFLVPVAGETHSEDLQHTEHLIVLLLILALAFVDDVFLQQLLVPSNKQFFIATALMESLKQVHNSVDDDTDRDEADSLNLEDDVPDGRKAQTVAAGSYERKVVIEQQVTIEHADPALSEDRQDYHDLEDTAYDLAVQVELREGSSPGVDHQISEDTHSDRTVYCVKDHHSWKGYSVEAKNCRVDNLIDQVGHARLPGLEFRLLFDEEIDFPVLGLVPDAVASALFDFEFGVIIEGPETQESSLKDLVVQSGENIRSQSLKAVGVVAAS